MIKDCTIHEAQTCLASTTLVDVAKQLKDVPDRHLFVLEDDAPVGLLSPLDICKAVADEKKVSELTAKDVMSSPVATAENDQEVEFALKIMMKYNTLTCPVTDAGKLLGVVDYAEVFEKVSKKVAEHGLR